MPSEPEREANEFSINGRRSKVPGVQTPEGLFQGLIRGPHLWRVWPLAKAMKTFRLGRTRPLQRANYLGTGKKRGKKSWLEFQRKKVTIHKPCLVVRRPPPFLPPLCH